VTSQPSLQIETLWTIGTGKVSRDALMHLLMELKIFQITGRIIALRAVELANVLVIVDDLLAQVLTASAKELWIVRNIILGPESSISYS
jgi:hypothetical protein